MVHYRFETNENNRTMNVNAELPSVSWIEVIKHIFFTILLGLNIGYVQYLLFYDQRPFDEELNLYNQTMMMFYLVAAAVKMAFSVRMFINANESNFMTIASVSLLFLLMKTLSEIFQPPPISLFIFIYTYVFTSLFLFFQMTALLTNIFVTKYAVQYKLADGEEKRKFYMLMINAEADAGLVSVLDCYVRAAPQLIAQSAIFLYNNGNSTFFSGKYPKKSFW
jgi:membrane-associated HD superfamily phosphohydrolase